MATASSGCTSEEGFISVSSSSMVWMTGIRVLPPTSRILSMSPYSSPASSRVRCMTLTVVSRMVSIRSSKVSLSSSTEKSSPLMYRDISVVSSELSSFLAVSAWIIRFW